MNARRMHPGILAAVLLAIATAVPAAELGRLFLTPAERAALEQSRRQLAEPAPAPAIPDVLPLDVVEEILPEDLAAIRVDGYVQRTGGPATVWINGTDSYQGDLGEFGIDARQVGVEAAQVRVPVAGTGKTVTLKPGQSYDPGDGTVSDDYEGGDPP